MRTTTNNKTSELKAYMCTSTLEHDQAVSVAEMMSANRRKLSLMQTCPQGALFEPANEYEDLMFPSLVYDLAKERSQKKAIRQMSNRQMSNSRVVETRQCGVILTKHNCSSISNDSLEHLYEDILSPTVNNNAKDTSRRDICRSSPEDALPNLEDSSRADSCQKNICQKVTFRKDTCHRTPAVAPPRLFAFKSLSDTDLRRGFRMADTEMEVYTKVTTGNFLDVRSPAAPAAPLPEKNADTTFNTYGAFPEPEQGFYRCHDNLEDIDELDLIPDLFSARKTRANPVRTPADHTTANQSTASYHPTANCSKAEGAQSENCRKLNRVNSDKCLPANVSKADELEKDTRRNSFDSGRGSSTSTLIRTDKEEMEEVSSCSRNCLCSSCCSISPGKLSLGDNKCHQYENFLLPPKGALKLSPPPPPLPPKNRQSHLPALPPKPTTDKPTAASKSNVEESVRALQSLSNDLLGLIESTKKDTSSRSVTLCGSNNPEDEKIREKESRPPINKAVARILDFEELEEVDPEEKEEDLPKEEVAKTPKRNRPLFRSLRKDSPSLKKVIKHASPSMSIVRKRKYLLCSPKIKAGKDPAHRKSPSPAKGASPRKKRAKQETDDKENASPDYRSFKARAAAHNLPVIPFYLATPSDGAPSVVGSCNNDDYMVMTPQLTPMSRQSFLPTPSTTVGSLASSSQHCQSCTCGNHHPVVRTSRRLPPPPPPPLTVKHTKL